MNTLDLQNLGLEEMNEMEVRDVEGGSGGAWLLGLIVRIMYEGGDDANNPNLPGNKI